MSKTANDATADSQRDSPARCRPETIVSVRSVGWHAHSKKKALTRAYATPHILQTETCQVRVLRTFGGLTIVQTQRQSCEDQSLDVYSRTQDHSGLNSIGSEYRDASLIMQHEPIEQRKYFLAWQGLRQPKICETSLTRY